MGVIGLSRSQLSYLSADHLWIPHLPVSGFSLNLKFLEFSELIEKYYYFQNFLNSKQMILRILENWRLESSIFNASQHSRCKSGCSNVLLLYIKQSKCFNENKYKYYEIWQSKKNQNEIKSKLLNRANSNILWSWVTFAKKIRQAKKHQKWVYISSYIFFMIQRPFLIICKIPSPIW